MRHQDQRRRDGRTEGGESHDHLVRRAAGRVEETADALRQKSLYQRTPGPKGEVVLTNKNNESIKYTLNRVKDPEDPRVGKIHQFMVDQLQKDGDVNDADTIQTMQEALKSKWGEYVVIEDAKGEVVAFSCHAVLASRPPQGDSFVKPTKPKEGIGYSAYIMRDEAYKDEGLLAELYMEGCRYMSTKALEDGIVLKYLAYEGADEELGFLNAVGLKRMYFEDKEGNVREVLFKFASHDYDEKTGMPTLEPELIHLMGQRVDASQTMSVDDVLSMIKTVFAENYILNTLEIPEAKSGNKKHVLEIYSELAEQLKQSKDGKVFFMTEEERKVRKFKSALDGREKVIDFVAE